MKRQAAMRFRIAGRIWRWIYRPLRNDYGVCNYTDRTITIDSGRAHAGLDRIDTEIHEALHALQVFATEEHTAEVASTLAGILWGLGYRLTEKHAGRGYLGE